MVVKFGILCIRQHFVCQALLLLAFHEIVISNNIQYLIYYFSKRLESGTREWNWLLDSRRGLMRRMDWHVWTFDVVHHTCRTSFLEILKNSGVCKSYVLYLFFFWAGLQFWSLCMVSSRSNLLPFCQEQDLLSWKWSSIKEVGIPLYTSNFHFVDPSWAGTFISYKMMLVWYFLTFELALVLVKLLSSFKFCIFVGEWPAFAFRYMVIFI